MTHKTHRNLVKTREWMNVIAWLLMIINLSIGIITTTYSIIVGHPIISQKVSLITIMLIAMVIGILALSDMIIYKKIVKSKK